MKLPPLILASASPRRRTLLKQIGLTFTVRPSRVEEEIRLSESPSANVKRIALEKARDTLRIAKQGIIIGADTIVVLDNKILGKPRSKNEARTMLHKLSGREHSVYTGFVLIDAGTRKKVSGAERTRVRFRELGKEEINRYVALGSPMDKAGAYGIQDDYGAVFVEKVNGCFYNVMGFPLSRFYRELLAFVKKLETNNVR
ncbi:MAG: Maf family protein [Ignavibacteriae bacterium]|nr:Maf family protein [Ignavibacteriota bacterium]